MTDAPIEGRKYEVVTDENGSTTIRVQVREGDNLAWYWLEERDINDEWFNSVPDDPEEPLTVGGRAILLDRASHAGLLTLRKA